MLRNFEESHQYHALLQNRFQPVIVSNGICLRRLRHINGNYCAWINSAFRLNSAEQRSGPKVVNDRATALFLRQRASLSVFHFSGKIVWNICICSFRIVPAIHFSYFVGSYYILVPGYQCKLHCFEVPQDFQPLRNTHSTHSKQNRRTGFVGAVKLLGLWVTGTPCHFDGLKSGPDK